MKGCQRWLFTSLSCMQAEPWKTRLELIYTMEKLKDKESTFLLELKYDPISLQVTVMVSGRCSRILVEEDVIPLSHSLSHKKNLWF